jgi:hypothetical protein
MFDTRIFPSNKAQIAFAFVMGGHKGAASWLAISSDSQLAGGWRLRQNGATLGPGGQRSSPWAGASAGA